MTKQKDSLTESKTLKSSMTLRFLCEDFQTFVDEIQEWGVYHICGVDFDDPDINLDYA